MRFVVSIIAVEMAGGSKPRFQATVIFRNLVAWTRFLSCGTNGFEKILQLLDLAALSVTTEMVY